jgi:uncharacterized protein YjcR
MVSAWKAYKTGKETLKKAEELNIKNIDKNVESIKKMIVGLSGKNLKLLKSKVGEVLESSPGTIRKWMNRLFWGGTGAAAIPTYSKVKDYVGSRLEKAKKMDKAKGGSVRKMKAGGSVSRGTGAAIKGTKFKGVF